MYTVAANDADSDEEEESPFEDTEETSGGKTEEELTGNDWTMYMPLSSLLLSLLPSHNLS